MKNRHIEVLDAGRTNEIAFSSARLESPSSIWSHSSLDIFDGGRYSLVPYATHTVDTPLLQTWRGLSEYSKPEPTSC